MATNLLDSIFNRMLELNASDVYITVGKSPTYRVIDALVPYDEQNLNSDAVLFIISKLLTSSQEEEFQKKREYNIALNWQDKSRFRVNFFYQQLYPGIVIRRVKTDIPTIESLSLPNICKEIIMKKKGLFLISSPTGSGKSTSVAAILNHRNMNSCGHIVTIEDPIEFIHPHKNCIFTQREIAIDTNSYSEALKNVLRQRADVIFIGEIRDRETMDSAINFAETGHLCIATMHSNNTSQAIFRILNFYPEESHKHILYNLSINLEAIMSQMLVPNKEKGKSLATEIMLNAGAIRNFIFEGKINEINEMLDKQITQGMNSFDSCLYNMCKNDIITEEVALYHSFTPANLKLRLLQSNLVIETIPTKSNPSPTDINNIF